MSESARHGRVERIAVLSDVHGNLTAYQAVLDDITARGITRVISLGDHIGKGPRGSACVALTQQRCEAAVLGNWEAFLTSGGPVQPVGRWAREEVTPEQLAWLAGLPFCHDLVLSGRRVRLFHASAGSVFDRVSYDHTWEEFHAMFVPTPATGDGPAPDVVGCGDIHGTYLQGDDNKTLFNVGSVGNPLDAPTASYAVLEGLPDAGSGPFSIAFTRVAYDIEAEIAIAAQVGMPEVEEYADELREGIYRGNQRKPPPSPASI
ncbi:MAG: metallophosphoesterase family protein [Lapillicoccus sp.]